MSHFRLCSVGFGVVQVPMIVTNSAMHGTEGASHGLDETRSEAPRRLDLGLIVLTSVRLIKVTFSWARIGQTA